MRGNWKIGSLLGIPLYLDSSWFIILVLITLTNAQDIRAQNLTPNQPWLGWLAGLILALLLFSSVLLHELGHSLVARSQGIVVNSITLFLFGGVASIERESSTAKGALAIAIAGPAVSFLLFGLFSGILTLSQSSPLFVYMLTDIARINLVLGIFNLIPGLPLDGGQVLAALIWQVSGDRSQGIKWAAAGGKFFGALAIALSLLMVLLTRQLSGIWLGLIGWFILRNAIRYEKTSDLQEGLKTVSAGEAMSREFRVVDAHLTIGEFTETYLLSNLGTELGTQLSYFAASEGRFRGLIRVADVQALERSAWERTSLGDIAHPLTRIPAVTEKTSLLESIIALDHSGQTRITVLSPSGAVAGTIDRGDIVAAIAKKINLSLPDGEIQRIKAAGRYPDYLQLSKFAKSLTA
jgi:Zn-dependent protease